MRLRQALVLIMLVALPGWAAAASTGTYIIVYDNLDPIYEGIRRMALMFSDQQIVSTAYAIGMAGLAVGALNFLARVAGGASASPVSFLFPFVLGAAVLAAVIVPKKDLIVFDVAQFRFEAVGDVPAPLATLMNWVSQAESLMINIIDRSAPPGPAQLWTYRYNANGAVIDIMLRALLEAPNLQDQYLNRSVQKYYEDCVTAALDWPGTGLDRNTLLSGNMDLMNELGKAALHAVPTVYYTATNPNGNVVSCNQAWTSLSQDLNAPGTLNAFSNMVLRACAAHGWRTSARDNNSAGSGSYTGGFWGNLSGLNYSDQQCLGMFGQSVKLVVGENAPTPFPANMAGAPQFMRHMYLTRQLAEWVESGNSTQLSNYYQILDKIGGTLNANEWVPVIRGAMYGVAYSLFPFALLFAVTGVAVRALFWVLGMVGWLMMWNVMDALTLSFMTEYAMRLFVSAQANQTGLLGMMLAGDSAVKAMVGFADVRIMSMLFATSFMYVVFRFGGLAAAQIANSVAASAQKTGAEAMRKTADPAGHAQMLEALAQSDATAFKMASGGYQGLSTAAQFTSGVTQATALKTVRAAGGLPEAVDGASDAAAADAAGRIDAVRQAGFEATRAGANVRASGQAGQGAEALRQSGGTPAGVSGLGQELGGFALQSQSARMNALGAAASALGMSTQQLLNSMEGSNLSVAMSGEQMNRFLDSPAGQRIKMTPQMEQSLRQNGGVVNFAMGDSGGGVFSGPVSMSISQKSSSSVDGSATHNTGTTIDNSVQSRSGFEGNNQMAYHNPEAVAAGLRQLAGDFAQAAAASAQSGNWRPLMGAMQQYMEFFSGAAGVEFTAVVQETGDGGLRADAGVSGDYGIRGSTQIGGKGASTVKRGGGGSISGSVNYGGMDTRREYAVGKGDGAYAELQQWAQNATHGLQEWVAEGNDLNAGIRAELGKFMGEGIDWVESRVGQVASASEHQAGALDHRAAWQVVRDAAAHPAETLERAGQWVREQADGIGSWVREEAERDQ